MSYIGEIAEAIYAEVSPGGRLEPKMKPLYLMYAVLCLSRGNDVTTEDVHDAWSAWAEISEPNHRSLRRFEDLPRAVQVEDLPFVEAIRKVASETDKARKKRPAVRRIAL